MKAECLFRQENYKEAWPAYQAAAKTKASTPTIEVLTLLHGGQSAAQLKQWDESVKLLAADSREASRDRRWCPKRSTSWAGRSRTCGKTDEALKDYEAAATQVARSRRGAGPLHDGRAATSQQKKHDEASREFQRAMFGYGGEQATPETKNWQAKSGYEAGRCAEVQIAAAKDAAAKQKLIADAKRFYTFVAEKHASHELAAEAKKRLDGARASCRRAAPFSPAANAVHVRERSENDR